MGRDEYDDFAGRAYGVERLRMHDHGVQLGYEPYFMPHSVGVEQFSRRPRSLSPSPQREEGPGRVSWRRSGLMDRDQDFSDRGDIMEPQLRSGLMRREEKFSDRGDMVEPRLRHVLVDGDQDFTERGDIMEPQLRSGLIERGDIIKPESRSGLMERDEEFRDRFYKMQPQLKSLACRPVHEKKPRHHYQASSGNRDEIRRRYDEFLMMKTDMKLGPGGAGVNYDYGYDSDISVQECNANRERISGSIHHRGLDRQKLFDLEDESSQGGHTLPFDSQSTSKYVETARRPLSVHVQPQQIRLRDEVSHYHDPFLLDKLSAIEMIEREERSGFHPKDVSRYLESASRSKNPAASSQYKEHVTTSSGISRMNYAPVVQDDMQLLGDIHSRSSTKLRQPSYFNEYGENHSYNNLEEYAAGHKERTSYQYDKVSPPTGDDMDYLYPKGRPRGSSNYSHSYERTSMLGQAVLDKKHPQSPIYLEPLRENTDDAGFPRRDDDAGFPRRDVINSHSWDHHSFTKQSVSMNLLDARSLVRSSQDQFYVDPGDTNVDMRNVRESDIENFDVPCHEEIPRRHLDYHSSKDGHHISYVERGRRSTRHGHEMEMLGDRIQLKKIESGVIGTNCYPIRSVKRKHILDEETMGHKSRQVVCSKWKKNVTRNQDLDCRNEVWDDQDSSGLLSPESFEDDEWFGKAEKTYSGDLYGRVTSADGLLSYHCSTNQGQRHLIRPYNPGKKQKVHEHPSSLRPYVSIQCNRKFHLTKNVWIRGKDYKNTEGSDHIVEGVKDQIACAKTELPEDSLEFKQLVNKFFLYSTKKLSESVSTQKRYKEQGRAGGLYCIVCPKSQSKEFTDTRALAKHCFMSKKVGLKAKHLGLHNAICVLMGWNSDAPTEGKLWAPVAVPAPTALAQKEDLILWPPVVVIHNCSAFVTGLDERKVMTTEAVEDFLRGKGFSGGRMKVCLGKPGNGSVLLVKFLGTIPGFQDAEKLHYYFMGEEHGRTDFGIATSTKGKGMNRNVKGGEVEELLLYGYLGIAEDLDKVDNDTKRKCLIKSKKEIHDFVDAPVNPVEGD